MRLTQVFIDESMVFRLSSILNRSSWIHLTVLVRTGIDSLSRRRCQVCKIPSSLVQLTCWESRVIRNTRWFAFKSLSHTIQIHWCLSISFFVTSTWLLLGLRELIVPLFGVLFASSTWEGIWLIARGLLNKHWRSYIHYLAIFNDLILRWTTHLLV